MPNQTQTALVTTNTNTKLATKATATKAVAVAATPAQPAAVPSYSHAATASTSKRAWAPKANTVPGVYVTLLQAAGKAGVPYATMAAAIAACPTAKPHSVAPLAKWLAANRGIGSMCANGVISLL